MLKNLSINMFEERESDIIDKKQKVKTSFRQIWSVLHTTASYLPSRLSEEEESNYRAFVEATLYFGSKKNEEWKKMIEEAKNFVRLDFSSRDSSVLSLCHFHNKINWELGKEQQVCNIETLNATWGHH